MLINANSPIAEDLPRFLYWFLYIFIIIHVSQGASTRRVHPKGVVEVFAFFGSLDGPEQNKT